MPIPKYSHLLLPTLAKQSLCLQKAHKTTQTEVVARRNIRVTLPGKRSGCWADAYHGQVEFEVLWHLE